MTYVSDSNACDEGQFSVWLNLMELGQYSADIAGERRQHFHAGRTEISD